MVESAILCEEIGYAWRPSPLLSNASAGLFDSSRRAPTSSAPSGCPGSPQASRACRRRLRRPTRASGRRRRRRVGPGLERRRRGDARGGGRCRARAPRPDRRDPRLRRAAASGGEPLPGDVEQAADEAVVALAAELTGVAAAGDGDGGRVREGARAVRSPDRRLPGRLAPLRRDALRRRGVALAHLLRGLDRGRASRSRCRWPPSMAKARASDAATWR